MGKDGKAEVCIRVLVDTLGVADMGTFTVVKSTHPTLTRSVRSAVAKWKFVPAEVSGCRVPGTSTGGQSPAAPRPATTATSDVSRSTVRRLPPSASAKPAA